MKNITIHKNTLFTILLLFALSFLNISRNLDNDLSNYIEIFNFFRNHFFLEIFGNSDFLFTVKPSEPVFYFTTFLFSKLFFGKAYLYVGAITLSFYLNFIFGIFKLLRKFEVPKKNNFSYVCILIFACINFSETSHLLRQYFAASFLPLLIFYLLNKNITKAILLSIFIVLTHNSLLIIIFLLFLSKFYQTYNSINQLLTKISTIVIFLFFLYYSLNYLNALSYFDEASDIKYVSIYYDFLILTLYFAFTFTLKKKLPTWNIFFSSFTIFFLIFLFNLTFSETVFLRFYLNIEWFRFFYFMIIIFSFNILNISKFYKIFFYSLILIVFILRLVVSPWHYFTFDLFL